MSHYWKRVEELVRRTGDRVVLTDPQMEKEPLVLMSLTAYESLIDIAEFVEEEFAAEGEEDIVQEDRAPDIWDVMPEAGDTAQTWDLEQLSEEELSQVTEVFEGGNEASVEAKEQPSEPVAPEVEDSSEFSEEQFYLEPIE